MTQDKRISTRATAARCIIAATGLAAVAACGSVAAPGSGGGSGSGGSSPAAAKASLNIVVQGAPGTRPKHWTLQCDPAGGSHPNPAAACHALESVKSVFAAAPPHHMCPMIVASARRATFTGTWFGTKVNRTIIDGGCDLARWSKLGQVMH
jgi:hypothetical protein